MQSLGRINLLVGTNNCGKTSVLEAINILAAPGSPVAVWRSLTRRGEVRDDSDEREVELGHLFHGHEISSDARFVIGGKNATTALQVVASFAERDPKAALPRSRVRRGIQRELFQTNEADDDSRVGSLELRLAWDWNGRTLETRVPIFRGGGLSLDYFEPTRSVDDAAPVLFITTEALSRDQIVSLFEDAVLTPEEETILAALRTIEPSIERIAPVGTIRRRYSGADRGGIAVKLPEGRVPIGSLGDGIWRMLGIALALVRAKGGFLLVDEIDTGLHHTVLARMWKLVYETASRLDVQVFATTHSRDCYESLASVRSPSGTDVTIQRIERGAKLAVAFTEIEIQHAARRAVEIR